MPVTYKDLAPEEQELIAQLGKISRPFAHDATTQTRVAKLTDFYHSLTVAAKTWEVVGVDISAWQGDVDFSILVMLAQFVIIRYGIGNKSRDSKAARNVAGAKAQKMPHAGYWYLKPEKDWREHAASFMQAIMELGGELPHVSDFEENGGLNKTLLDSWLQKFFEALFNALVNDGIVIDANDLMWYTSKNVCDSMLPVPNGWMRYSRLDVAHWTTAPAPQLPTEWAVANKPWTFWQYGFGDGRTYGAESDKIDLQRYWGTRADFVKEFGIALPQPPPPPIGNIPEYVIVNVDTLRVRPVPNDKPETPIVARVSLGTVLRTTRASFPDYLGRGTWYQISDEHGQTMWVAGWLVRPKP